MELKMTETYQESEVCGETLEGTPVKVLLPDSVYKVGSELGKWLLENKKAVEINFVANPARDESPAVVGGGDAGTSLSYTVEPPIMNAERKRGRK